MNPNLNEKIRRLGTRKRQVIVRVFLVSVWELYAWTDE